MAIASATSAMQNACAAPQHKPASTGAVNQVRFRDDDALSCDVSCDQNEADRSRVSKRGCVGLPRSDSGNFPKTSLKLSVRRVGKTGL